NDDIHVTLKNGTVLRDDFTTNGHNHILSLRGGQQPDEAIPCCEEITSQLALATCARNDM
ncbi:MAG TPA: hypothetical protein VHO49_19890, partial [Anaerolineales bacterium]|nr:hypothetical protein [Anaerolineales bacterium]